MTPGLDAGAKNDLAVKESSMPRELAEADAISDRLRKSPCWLSEPAGSASGQRLLDRGIDSCGHLPAGKTLFAYLRAGCPFRTDWGATSLNVSQ